MIDSSSTDATSARLAARYGGAPPAQRRLLIAVIAVVGCVLLGWLVWAAWLHSTPDVRGALHSYDVTSAHEVTVRLDITRSSGDAVECTVQAQSSDHAVVGEQVVTIPAGSSGNISFEATVKTDREATNASVSNCH